MSDYNLREPEEIIAAGDERLEELHDTIMKTFTEAVDGGTAAAGCYEISCAVAGGLQERVDYLRAELEGANAVMVVGYEADLEETTGDYPREGGALDEEGQSVDRDLLADVFHRVQNSCLESGLWRAANLSRALPPYTPEPPRRVRPAALGVSSRSRQRLQVSRYLCGCVTYSSRERPRAACALPKKPIATSRATMLPFVVDLFPLMRRMRYL